MRNVTCDRPAYRVGRYDSLPHDIERSFKELLMMEIEYARRLENCRKDLESRFDYSTLAAYRTIDKYNDGCINMHNLGSFLRACGHYAKERELVQIIRRIDTTGTGKLSFQDFSDFIRC